MCHRLVFWCNIFDFIVHCLVFVCQTNICSDYFRTLSTWSRKRVFLGDLTAGCSFFTAEFILFVVVFISFLWWYFLEAPICTTIFITVEHVLMRNPTCLTQLFNFLKLFFIYHVPPIFLDFESICFGASTMLIPKFIDNIKGVLSYNLHAMGGICKEGWLWDFLIKLSFG